MTDDELRDDFGTEITEALRLRSRGPAATPTVQHEPHPAGPRRRKVAAAVAFAVGAAATFALVAVVRDPDTNDRVRVARPSTPSGFAPLATGIASWTWVNDEHGWALVRRPCGDGVCPELRETLDGGRTWRSVSIPPALDASAVEDPDTGCVAAACISGVRFATPDVGWLFGPALFETRDGGRTWARLPDVRVRQVEASAGTAMRVTSRDGRCSYDSVGCAEGIDRTPVGSDAWQPVHDPSVVGPSLILQGTDAYAVGIPNWAGAHSTQIEHSSDDGESWTPVADPCPDTSDMRGASVSAAPGGVLTVLCAAVVDRSTPAAVRVSTDRGRTFGPPQVVIGDASNRISIVAAGSADTIAVAYSDASEHGVVVSNDGGATWDTTLRADVPPNRAGTFAPTLGWQDAQTARVSFDGAVIWTTRDRGRNWIRQPVGL